MDSIDAGWISGIYYGSYMISVMILVSLTDWIDAKRIYIVGVLITLISCIGFALFVEGYWERNVFQNSGRNRPGRNLYARPESSDRPSLWYI